ncbi:hypothetical protein BJ322DRAFT_1022539 [Thelephora terrestris]|uniref:Tse2 ADP-ribosyltransferase toxin domain-containing protein n=1 Tax=Thelephora terrestris TaxID=56493 RepID=A0A9P6L3Q2_9AGAM|nr:hypothetical protein BJ322DRAFT_1022539 [Thelephora terrestris]
MNRIKVIVERFNVLPATIYRIQNKNSTFKLRDLGSQSLAGRSSFDLILDSEGNALPLEGDEYKVPNGASARPLGENLLRILSNWRGDNIKIYEVQKGTKLPEGAIAVQEEGDHISLQCSKKMKKECE